MMFTNINISSITIICILFAFVCYLCACLFSRDFNRQQIAILFGIFLLLILSILGPKGGMNSVTSQTLGGNIAFVVDVSKSMDARDFDNNNISRLQMTKSIISRYIQSQQQNRYALDAFSGDAVKLIPFTSDISMYQTILGGIDESNVGQSGTDIIKALYSSVSHFTADDTAGLIVVFTDGGDEEIVGFGEIKDVLKEKNITVLIVGIGSTDGNYIPVGIDFFGRMTYKTYQGQKVITKLNSGELRDLGSELGEYVEIGLDGDIDELSTFIDTLSEKVTFESNIDQRRNLVGIFVLFGFILWLLFLGNICLSKYRKK